MLQHQNYALLSKRLILYIFLLVLRSKSGQITENPARQRTTRHFQNNNLPGKYFGIVVAGHRSSKSPCAP